MQKRIKIFTWHIHGSYLYYLSKGDWDIYIPVDGERSEGYSGRGTTFQFGENVIEIPASQVKDEVFDCILFQSKKNYLTDQFHILSEAQQQLPCIYLEHDPPRETPTDTLHVVADPRVLVVHVTNFNALMWHNVGPVQVIDHGVCDNGNIYSGTIEKGIVVVNNITKRGRRLGADIFETIRNDIPLDLVGMGTLADGGLGEVLFHDLPSFAAQYRFFFNPIRYTSLGLAFLEAMMAGIPVVCLATTEYTTVIQNGINGYAHTDLDYLREKMKLLLSNPEHAASIGQRGREAAIRRFGIGRFLHRWNQLFESIIYKNKRIYEKENSAYK